MYANKYKTHISGICTGVSQTILFNPVDRALYLHMINNTKFINKANWLSPYQGMSNSIISRCISYGYYYTIIDTFNNYTDKYIDNKTTQHIATGILTGMTTSVLINPMNAIKYHSWGNNTRKLTKTMVNMYKNNGFKSFTRGLASTIKRDCTFSTIYTYADPKRKQYITISSYYRTN